MSLDFLSPWLHSFCSRRGPAAAACNDDGVPVNSTIDCARDGRLTILAKRTRAGANSGSAYWKEPGEETPTFPCADFPRDRSADEPRPRVHARRDGGERPEQYMIMQLELAPAQPGTG